MTNRSKLIGYVGTYTKGESKGIYTFTLDTAQAEISGVTAAAELDNPTYLTISKDNQFLYSVVKEGEAGGVAAFKVNGETGQLQAINSQASAGAPPCHLSVDSEKRLVMTANYHRGTVESYLLNKENGAVQPASSIIQFEGTGPNKERQEKPHTHYADFTPDGKYIVVVDLGIDKVLTYTENNGELTEVNSLSVKPGSGPRHLVFHPNKKYAYIMTELSSEVIAVQYNEQDGSFTELQYISTIPNDFTENNQGSAIHMSSDGRFVYAANRGHNSIAVFSVNADTGELTLVELTSTEGDWPRDFVLDPTEKFLVASNQNTGNLVLFARDEVSGKLQLLQADIAVPDPVCVKFLNI
ncbi:6-phosphogluconolactonase [Bacillus sp. V3-13]|uniref:lactonase family protein n=1 Tax=Bacillus sp. V3-13 TaxID=2053728 RepID=UPI000C787EA4|nr:lactonase family protein [Bacillus sp. V3-13]PLR77343.1 6-phosphogluconolactonase [Bacillus sp. V3-13]